ncbi:nitronate monooxygenase family protein [Mesorhizobium sp. 1M-11]|uniref:NAD(P)H-dependent flavin oxidoreductase n=1 Tax=Mesorhizobium sp. 1M-11 TaxID=1529006 RepID=UPI0009EAF358|nr:nitronate monooxygenase family protein [Mesorhizobium sp. 1M-11]
MWPDRRIVDLFGIDLPIIQAPMAGPVFADMVVAVAEAGGLGSLPCATMGAEQVRSELGTIRGRTNRPINVNFFCHAVPSVDAEREANWRRQLRPYYVEFGLDPDGPVPVSNRTPFDEQLCTLVEEFRPEVVSFHFGLPDRHLLDRVRATGAKILSSATTVDEARWLEDRGCDAIIAQGFEAGGHRGNFLTEDIATQVGTFALVPQVVDAVKVPVIAAGGIADARGIVAAFALGASAVQIGTAYLFTPQARISKPHHEALRSPMAERTVLTNVFTGRPARGMINRVMREVGPMSEKAPAFPLAGGALAPLRAASEKAGSGDFMSLWSGQAASLCREVSAGELTRKLASEALARLAALGEVDRPAGLSR